MNNRMNKTIIVIWVVLAMMAAGCGKIRTCQCYHISHIDIIDTALYDSMPIPIYDNSVPFYDDYVSIERESAVECSYWNIHDTVGTYLPKYGIREYYDIECHEQGERPQGSLSKKGEK